MSKNRNYLSHREIQQEELRILDAFDSFCKAHDLNYSLAYGTLLGAVRHNGFIPWDDDIDITMPRPDYERLQTYYRLPSDDMDLLLVNCRSNQGEAYPSAYTKLINRKIGIEEALTHYSVKQYLWIDIFPMDAVTTYEKERRRLKRKLKWHAKLLNIPLAKSRSRSSEFVKRGLRIFVRNPYLYARRIDEALLSIDFNSCDNVTDYFSWIEGKCVCYKKSNALNTELMIFENRSFPVISCWEEQLTGIYGDFWKLPSENERISHNLKAWRMDD